MSASHTAWTLRAVPELASTNETMLEQAALGAADNSWLRADRQTAGRGRRGRAWESPAGNLLLSGVARARAGEGMLAQLSFVAALAVREALSQWVPAGRLLLKWPNDVLLDGAKVCGILLETRATPRELPWVVVGIGVNLAHHPTGLERPATSVCAATGAAPDPGTVAPAVIAAFDGWRQRWREGGFAPIRAAWLATASGLGARIEARLTCRTLAGQFLDLAEDGALVLRLDSGVVETLHAADVFEGTGHAARD